MVSVMIVYEDENGLTYEDELEVLEDNIQDEMNDIIKNLRNNGYYLIDWWCL